MICFLCEPGTEAAGQAIAYAIQARYKPSATPELCEAKTGWTKSSEWDDLLLVVYQSEHLQPEAQRFITEYRDAHSLSDPATGELKPGGFIIPVATNAASVRPPEPISGIKAALYDGSPESQEPILCAIGTLLGMAVRPGAHHIFISYRSSDGTTIASDLFKRLQAVGFHPWLDEAKDNLPPGTDVQPEIMTRIKSASMVVIVDTPDVKDSLWMRQEINEAIGWIPLLPVVVGPDNISRFQVLRPLQRRVPVKSAGIDSHPLSDAEWKSVFREIEEVLLLSYMRRMRVISHAENAFTVNNFQWSTVDLHKRMFRAHRQQRSMPPMIILSHCSIEDAKYVPALRVYKHFFDNYPDIARVAHKLCIYDDEILSDHEIADIDAEMNTLSFILAHHAELDTLISTDFARLR